MATLFTMLSLSSTGLLCGCVYARTCNILVVVLNENENNATTTTTTTTSGQQQQQVVDLNSLAAAESGQPTDAHREMIYDESARLENRQSVLVRAILVQELNV